MQQATPIPLLLFPLFFVGIWLLVNFILNAMSGWLAVSRRYPNRPETALRTFHMVSGSMGMNVNFSGVLRMSICPSGLRVGLLFLFAAFSREFFVPWSEIHITRAQGFLTKRARLDFGNPAVGTLILFARTADQLAAASEGLWPEKLEPSARREPTVS